MAKATTVRRPVCNCLVPPNEEGRWEELQFHPEEQDTECSGWLHLTELIEQAASDGREKFSLLGEMAAEEVWQIVELPPSIGTLKRVKHLVLAGCSLVRIPSEIGEMDALETLNAYMAHRLHWWPYEMTRCKDLKESSLSTRVLYGNFKNRGPFPELPCDHQRVPKECSVCGDPFGDMTPLQYWISLNVGTDVMPLLVHACSPACVADLPQPADNYVQSPHRGGLGVVQPDAGY